MHTAEEFEGMPRLARWMRNVRVACDVALGEGQYLSLRDALALLIPDDERHDMLLEKIAPHLPEEALADFRSLCTLSQQERMNQVEGAINRIRERALEEGMREEQ